MHARSAADGSAAAIRQIGEEWELWSEPDDAEAPVGIVLYESLAKLISDTRVENRLLRLRPER